VESAEVYPGQALTLSGGPLTTTYDTRAQIGGRDATVRDVSRTECDACDACREDAECSGCFACADCELTCETCVEALVIEVPSLPAGPAKLIVVNAYGSNAPLQLQILEADTGIDDTASIGLPDTASIGPQDTGDTATTSSPRQWYGHMPNADPISRDPNKNRQNLSEDEQATTSTFWTILSRVVDRLRAVMY
jgi:hypothetical protein